MIDVISYLPAKTQTQCRAGSVSMLPVVNTMAKVEIVAVVAALKTSDAGWSYHCFNCGYTASFILGRNLSFKARKLLSWLGVPGEEIERINLESLRHRSMEGLLTDRQRLKQHITRHRV
jgi:hypothetical protein